MSAQVTELPPMMRSIDDLTWADHGLCRGNGEIFYPPFAERPQTRVKRETKARQLCSQCPVQQACLTYGRHHHEYGIWGGENEEERVLAGYALHAPIGTRHLAALRRAEQPMAMPLAEITEPDDIDLADTEIWLGDTKVASRTTRRARPSGIAVAASA
jgi:WhiB family transcriptional regulator, redox-sensing transcriptional regulator